MTLHFRPDDPPPFDPVTLEWEGRALRGFITSVTTFMKYETGVGQHVGFRLATPGWTSGDQEPGAFDLTFSGADLERNGQTFRVRAGAQPIPRGAS